MAHVNNLVTNTGHKMTLEKARAALNEPGFNIMDCCRKTGLHPNTVYRIKNGKAERPNYLTMLALEQYLKHIGA